MAIFLTGSTGYIGAQLVARLFEHHADSLNLLVRAKSAHEAEQRLWRALQLNLDFAPFRDFLRSRVSVFLGDLTDSRFGLADADDRTPLTSLPGRLHAGLPKTRSSLLQTEG